MTDSIQPVGFAIVLSPEWLVERVSTNIADYFDTEPGALIGVPITAMLGGEAVHALRNQLALLREPRSIARLFACNSTTGCFDFALHAVGQRVLVEGQRTQGTEHGDTIATIRSLIGRLEQHDSVIPLLEDAVRQLRALTGFDRVACYGLDRKLLAQSVRDGAALPTTLDAGDFAACAAATAIVADRDAVPVALRPAGDGLDGRGLLRAPEPQMVELLETIDAVAALTMPLAVAGQQWGVILAAHGGPRYPGFERQSAIGLFVQMLGLLVGLAERRRD